MTAGKTVEVSLPFRNLSSVAAEWTFCVPPYTPAPLEDEDDAEAPALSGDGDFCTIWCEPESGTIGPLEQATVRVVCSAGRLQEVLRACVQCQVKHGNSQFVRVRADVRHPKSYLSLHEIKLGNTFLGLPVKRSFELFNRSAVPASGRFLSLLSPPPPQKKSGFLRLRHICFSFEARPF